MPADKVTIEILTMMFNVGDLHGWIRKIKSWAAIRKDVFYLSSCLVKPAADCGDYELLVGQGIRRQFLVDFGRPVDWQALEDFCRLSTWRFFVVAYEFNQQLYPEFSDAPQDCLKWPSLLIVEPEIVLALKRSGDLEIVASNPDDVYLSLAQLKPNETFEARVSGDMVMQDSLSAAEHYERVEKIRQHIASGDFYEMNLCLETVIDDIEINDPFALHQQLLNLSPTPFSSFVQIKNFHLLAASPERYMCKKGRQVVSQPIKGTSARHSDPTEDAASYEYLATSTKELAEHVMIVDLVRNDLGRFCRDGSVQVSELFGIYGYQQVYQMISTIVGECPSDINLLDILRHTYPMGSMTGAPKHQVMGAIQTLEKAARGWYSGSVGYIRPNGDVDSNVVIRALLYDSDARRGKFAVGGAITADSDASAEYEECLLKGKAIRHLLSDATRLKKNSSHQPPTNQSNLNLESLKLSATGEK